MGGRANGKRRLLRTVGLQSELQASLGSSDCWLLGSHALPIVELCLVRRAEPYAKFLFPVCSAPASEALEDPPVALPSPRGPGPDLGGTFKRDPRSAERTVRLSIRLCAGLRPIAKGLRRKASTRHTGFPRSQRGSVAGNGGDCHSPAFLPRVAAAVRGDGCLPQLLFAGSGPTETSRITEGPIAPMRPKRRGMEQNKSTVAKLTHAQIRFTLRGGVYRPWEEQRDSICLSSTPCLSSPTWSSG